MLFRIATLGFLAFSAIAAQQQVPPDAPPPLDRPQPPNNPPNHPPFQPQQPNPNPNQNPNPNPKPNPDHPPDHPPLQPPQLKPNPNPNPNPDPNPNPNPNPDPNANPNANANPNHPPLQPQQLNPNANANPNPNHRNTGLGATIDAMLSEIGPTSVSVTIINRFPRDISLAKNNTFLDPNNESQCFSIRSHAGTPIQAKPVSSSQGQSVAAPDQGETIAAGSTWSKTYDLTRLFEIPMADVYNISFATTVFISTPPDEPTYPFQVSAHPLMMSLASSSPQRSPPEPAPPTRVKRDQIQQCDAGQTWVIQKALASAIQMASAAASYVPTTGTNSIYEKYFNNDKQQVVREVFKYIASYDIGIANGFDWYCNTSPDSKSYCQKHPLLEAYAPRIGSKLRYLTLCPGYFAQTWASTICHVPGADDGLPKGWQRDFDQPSIIMHEMLHDAKLAGLAGINDGNDDMTQGQYTYDQVTNLASNSRVNGDAPMKNAQSFVYFALEVRNITSTPQGQQCVRCPLQPPRSVCAQSPSSSACQKCNGFAG